MPGADPGPSQPKLLDRVRAAIRARHYSRRTEQAYVAWIRRYIVFHKKTHPAAMGAREVTAFLSWLASAKRVSASTQNQALSAVVFLYRHVLGIEVGTVEDVVRAKTPRRLPVVLTREEVGAVLKHLDGTMWMAGVLLYGAGLRLHECLDLRAKDVDFERNQLTICRGKGQKDRVTMLPVVVKVPLTEHLAAVRRQHAKDLERGAGRAPLPFAAFTALVSKRSHNVSALGRLSAGGFSCGWNDQELHAMLGRIRHFQEQVAHLRITEANPTNFRLSVSGFLAEIDRMQLEVREYLSLHLADPTVAR